MSRFFKKAAKKIGDKLDEKAKERQEWNKIKAKIEKEETVKYERQKIKDRLAHERKKARERLEKGSPLKRVLISGLKATGKIVKEELSDPNKAKKKKKS